MTTMGDLESLAWEASPGVAPQQVPGLDTLLEWLRLTEQQGLAHLGAPLAAHVSEHYQRTGMFRAASHWLGWSLQLYESVAPLPEDYWPALHQWVLVELLLQQPQEVERRLAWHGRQDASPSSSWWLQCARVHLDFAQGHLASAGRASDQLWSSARTREQLTAIANVHVRILLARGEDRTARDATERLAALSSGLDGVTRAKALVLGGLVLSGHDPAAGSERIGAAHHELPFPWQLQADLCEVVNLERLGDAQRARTAMRQLRPSLRELGPESLAFLLTPTLSRSVPLVNAGFRSDLRLVALGAPEVTYGSERLKMRPRFAELLVVLAAHPEGMSNAELTLAVYGEGFDPSCCKTEVYRLKKLVPIGNRPYQVQADVWADFLEVLELIEDGRADDAIDLYRGPLLPASDAPEVRRLRELVDAALCDAALAAASPEQLWKLANRMREDLELWEALLARLPSGDPRRSLARAHVHSLRRSWGA